jgi:hypothetical protein
VARSNRPGHSPLSPLPSLSPELWWLRRPVAAVLDSDGLRRSYPPRWVAIDRSRIDAPAGPWDLVDYPLVLSSSSPPALWILAMATSSFVSSCLAFPRRDLVLVGVVLCRRDVSAFPWLGAIVAMRALPCHATVIPPVRLVSSPVPLLPSVLLCALLELGLAMVLHAE